MCKHRTRFEPRYGETDAGKNEPDRVWQTHAPGDDRNENSYAEEADGVSENGVHHFNYSATRQSAVYFPPVHGRFCCESSLLAWRGLRLRFSTGRLIPLKPERLLRTLTFTNAPATRSTESHMAAAGRPIWRAVAGSGRWRPEQTHPGRLAGRAVEAGQASGCA